MITRVTETNGTKGFFVQLRGETATVHLDRSFAPGSPISFEVQVLDEAETMRLTGKTSRSRKIETLPEHEQTFEVVFRTTNLKKEVRERLLELSPPV